MGMFKKGISPPSGLSSPGDESLGARGRAARLLSRRAARTATPFTVFVPLE